MVKKITAFFVAFFIFTYTLTYCFYRPVFATVPVETDFSLLNDAISTLYFMTGLGYNTDSSHDDEWWFEYADAQTVAIWQNEQAAKKQRLDDAWEEFKDSVKRGYGIAFHLNEELYQELQDYSYSNAIAPNGINSNAPQSLRNWLSSQNGNIVLVNNSYGYGSYYLNMGNNSLLSSPVLDSSSLNGWDSNNQPVYLNTWRFTPVNSSNIRFTRAYVDNGNLRTEVVDWLKYGFVNVGGVQGQAVEYAYIYNHTSAYTNNSLIDSYITSGQYTDIIDDVYGVDNDGNVIIDSTGELPNVIGRSTLGGYSDAIDAGDTTWGDILGSMAVSEPAEPSIPAPDGSLTLPQLETLIADLHIERLETKFPFCIPHDLQLIFSGATAVSANAPVLNIPIHLEFDNHVYYDNQQAIHIDFSMFDGIIPIFKEGFFLLFLVGLLWVSIEILQAFFVVTE